MKWTKSFVFAAGTLLAVTLAGCGNVREEAKPSDLSETEVQSTQFFEESRETNHEQEAEKESEREPADSILDSDIIDIGEAYSKDPTAEDIVTDPETGLSYVKNQLLVSADFGTTKEQMEKVAEEVGADIVGYLEITADFQLEFRQDMDAEGLQSAADYMEGYPFVRLISLNLVNEVGLEEE